MSNARTCSAMLVSTRAYALQSNYERAEISQKEQMSIISLDEHRSAPRACKLSTQDRNMSDIAAQMSIN